jgi:hypothetical protein
MLIDLGFNAFNYSILGEVGFRVLADLVGRCPCYRLTYGSLDAALEAFEELESQAERPTQGAAPEARQKPAPALAVGGQP